MHMETAVLVLKAKFLDARTACSGLSCNDADTTHLVSETQACVVPLNAAWHAASKTACSTSIHLPTTVLLPFYWIHPRTWPPKVLSRGLSVRLCVFL
jgi:hypothetical protein